eukprot:s332_g30.t1
MAEPSEDLSQEDILAENASLRKQLADAQHRLQNLNEQYLEEVSYWRSRALELKLELAQAMPTEATAPTERGSEATGEPRPNGNHRSGREELQVREPEEVEKKLEDLLARKRETEARLAKGLELSEELQRQMCQQAVSLLTRDGAGPTDTFVNFLDQVDQATLRWVQQQIETRWKDLAPKGSGKMDGRVKKKKVCG